MAFFNVRTGPFNSRTSEAALVVADGDASFLKVLAQREFQLSDVIGVVHRTTDRDNLEVVGNRMVDLRQWYTEDVETSAQIGTTPRGIGIVVLRAGGLTDANSGFADL